MPPRMQPRPPLRKLRPLLRRKNFLDLVVRFLELSADLRLQAAEDLLDRFVMRVHDARDCVVLRRRKIQLVIEVAHDAMLAEGAEEGGASAVMVDDPSPESDRADDHADDERDGY